MASCERYQNANEYKTILNLKPNSKMDASLATRMRSRISSADYFCSFEISPPKQEGGYCEVLET